MWNYLVELSIMSGGLIPLMALLLLVTIAVIIERLYFYGRVLAAGKALEHDLRSVKYQGVDDLRKLSNHYKGTMQAVALNAGLESRGESAEDMDRHIEEAIMWQLPRMDRYMWVLDTAVTLAPLMGLFGTIIGMIDSFNVLGQNAAGKQSEVTGGIAHALIATGAGLFIAILAIVFLNYFNKRIRLALHQMELLKIMMINRLHGGGTGHASHAQARVEDGRLGGARPAHAAG
jgi:biopolymer transport protein ExbB